MKIEQVRRWAGVVALVVVLALVAYMAVAVEAPVARTYSTACYMEQGGAKFVCGSGGEIELQSGATLDVQSGVTTGFSGGVDLDGADLVIDTDGDSILGQTGSTDDAADVTLGAATGYFSVLTGNFRVGNGTPTVTQDGEDAYVEGQMEVDGEAQFDGAVDANSTADFQGAVTLQSTLDVQGGDITLENDETVSNSTDGVVSVNGMFGSLAYPITKTASYTATAAESGALYSNLGATAEITLTLPSAVQGYQYCIYVHAAYTMTVELDDADIIHTLTNAAGDRLQNTGTAGDSICLVALDAEYWAPVQEIGTWSDAN